MSLGSFLKSIWASIKSIFDGLPAEYKAAIHVGVIVTEAIKNFDDKDPEVANILTAVIPGQLDDQIKDRVRANLPVFLTELKLVDSTTGLSDPDQIVAAGIKVLQGLTGNIKSAFLHDLSILIAQVAADGELSWSDGVYVLQWYYEHQYTTSDDTSTATN